MEAYPWTVLGQAPDTSSWNCTCAKKADALSPCLLEFDWYTTGLPGFRRLTQLIVHAAGGFGMGEPL